MGCRKRMWPQCQDQKRVIPKVEKCLSKPTSGEEWEEPLQFLQALLRRILRMLKTLIRDPGDWSVLIVFYILFIYQLGCARSPSLSSLRFIYFWLLWVFVTAWGLSLVEWGLLFIVVLELLVVVPSFSKFETFWSLKHNCSQRRDCGFVFADNSLPWHLQISTFITTFGIESLSQLYQEAFASLQYSFQNSGYLLL